MNYTGTHPLNLIGKVAVVTSSSTPLGATICRALLNSNAFVLGIDVSTPHASTQSSKASHFQFLKSSALELDRGAAVEKAVGHHFGKEGVDFVVDVIGTGTDGKGEGEVGRMGDVLERMAGRGRGGVLSVICGSESESVRGDEEDVVVKVKEASKVYGKSGVRWNVLVSREVISDSNHRFILDAETKEALETHISGFHSERVKKGYEIDRERVMAHLVLFFCTSRGSEVSGALVGIDGTCVSL